jgi:hypothetical protein
MRPALRISGSFDWRLILGSLDVRAANWLADPDTDADQNCDAVSQFAVARATAIQYSAASNQSLLGHSVSPERTQMSSPLRLIRDDEDRLSHAPGTFHSSRVVPFVALSVRAQEDARRRAKKLHLLTTHNPHGAVLVEAFIDTLLSNGTQG